MRSKKASGLDIHHVQELKVFSKIASQCFQNLTVHYYWKNKALDCVYV